MIAQKADDLPALTGLRFVAALLIVLHHLRGVFGVPNSLDHFLQLDNGVSFFFVLSGFILTHVYRGQMGSPQRRRFYVARFARIWPTHMACILLLSVMDHAPRLRSTEDIVALFANLSLLQAWVPNYRIFFSLNAVSWTISTEVFFYMLFPFIAFQKQGRLLLWLAFSFALVVTMAVITGAIGAEPFQRDVSAISIDGMMYINPLSRLFEFILGIVTARLWFRWAPWLNEGRWKAPVLQMLALALTACAFAYAGQIASWAQGPLGQPFAMWMIKGGVTCLCSAFLIFAMAAKHGAPYRLFASGPLVYLGKISFALYLFHQIPLRAISRHADYFAGWSDGYGLAVYTVLILVVASLLHHLVEEPCRRKLVAKYGTRQSKPVPVAL